MEVKTGQLIAVSTGEYSDYGIKEYLRACKDFETAALVKLFKATGNYLAPPDWAPTDPPESYGCDDRFMAWLQSEGYAQPTEADEVVEWHIASYSDLDD